jgi:hypothetical protein
MSSLERCMTALGSFNYAGHIIFFVVYVLLEVVVPTPKKKVEKKKE